MNLSEAVSSRMVRQPETYKPTVENTTDANRRACAMDRCDVSDAGATAAICLNTGHLILPILASTLKQGFVYLVS